jgi:hypothetical protein
VGIAIRIYIDIIGCLHGLDLSSGGLDLSLASMARIETSNEPRTFDLI